MTDHTDALAREIHTAALVVEGWSEAGAAERAARMCPDAAYETAEQMHAASDPTEGIDR